jgi:predicted RNase H-like HicB family nuclease
MKNFHAVLWQEGDLYVAKALEVEVTSQGKTEKEAVGNLQEALELYFEDQDVASRSEIITVEKPKLQGISIKLHA